MAVVQIADAVGARHLIGQVIAKGPVAVVGNIAAIVISKHIVFAASDRAQQV